MNGPNTVLNLVCYRENEAQMWSNVFLNNIEVKQRHKASR